MKLDVLYEDEYIIACVKPYGVPSQPDKTYGVDMVTLVKEYLYEEAGEPYIAVINRLHRPVAGIILFAKDEDTAAKLSDMLQDGEISKDYQAVVEGFLDEPEGEYEDWILHDKRKNTSKIVPKGTKGAKKALLGYEVLDELDTDEGPVSYVLVELMTGRHHQIRCQMAAHGTPLWGDTKYNPRFTSASGRKSGSDKYPEIGLYSTRMEFIHPVTGEEIFLHREPEGKAFDIVDQMDF